MFLILLLASLGAASGSLVVGAGGYVFDRCSANYQLRMLRHMYNICILRIYAARLTCTTGYI